MNIKELKLGKKIEVYFYSMEKDTLEIKVKPFKCYVRKLVLNSCGRVDYAEIVSDDEEGDFVISDEDLDHINENFTMFSLSNDENTMIKYGSDLQTRAYVNMRSTLMKMSSLIREYRRNKKIEHNFKINNELTLDKEEQEFIDKNIFHSPEWLEYGLIDTGYITKEEAISMVQDRTNHINDDLISDFWNKYNNYAYVDNNVLELIKRLKSEYKIYLLSNINPYTYERVKESGLFEIVDGYVLSYLEHQIKPYDSIYKTLINRYNINPEESVFIDDNPKNIETANKLGFMGKKVEQDNYDSIINCLNELQIKGSD